MNRSVDVAVIGAGHAGLNAIKEIRKVTDNYVLINGGDLGTTCARIGCMPSKVAVHLAEAYQVRNRFERIGIQGAEHLQLDHTAALEHVRDLRDTFVDLVLSNTTDEMKEHELIEGYAEFISPNVISIGDQTIHAHATIIATGARSCVPSQWQDRFGDGFRVRAGDREVLVEKLFVSTGRRPNLDRMNIKRLGASLDERGVPHHDPETLQVGRLPIYLAGDATGGIANLQRAADQGRIAGYKAARGFAERFNQKTPMAIVFSEPNIACVGTEWSNLDESRTAVAQIRFGPVGRALIMGQNRGILRVYANEQSGRLLGAAMIGPRCEHLAHLIAWAVESRMTAQQALQMPFLSSGHRRGPTGRAARPVAQNRAPQEAVFPIGLWISAAPGTHKCKGRLNGAERRQGRAE